MMADNWHLKTVSELLKDLNTNERGLSASEAVARLKRYGPNLFPAVKPDSWGLIFLRQFQSPLIYILLLAAVGLALMGEVIDSLVIMFVLASNAVIGLFQEGKAQNTLQALKKFVETKATVWRDGRELIVLDREVVPGDVIILHEGEKVAADARLILANNLKVDQAAMTGESEPVLKTVTVPAASAAVAERANMIFKGTTVSAGHGQAVAVATGLETLVGRIAKQVQTIDTEIPLKTNIRDLSRLIIFFTLGLSLALFAWGTFAGKPTREMFATVLSLAVSVIPEGLPLVVTLILATGVWRMSKHHALVKKLQAVEALGQAQVIAVDKTGTITKNELVVQQVYVGGKKFEVGGNGYEPQGEIWRGGSPIDAVDEPGLALIGKVAAFGAGARVMWSTQDRLWRVAGDPTEAAMLVLAQKFGFHREELIERSPQLEEISFDYRSKYHAVVNQVEGRRWLSVIGAPEVVLDRATSIWRAGDQVGLKETDRRELREVFATMSRDGLRVIALARRIGYSGALSSAQVNELTFIGFLGIKDGLRPEVAEAMIRTKAAGIRVVMITGDHQLTARAIATEAGIWRPGDETLSGAEMDRLSDAELVVHLDRVSVFSRVTPDHKLRIINAFKHRGEIIAMTGDGVNDAPSLVAADLGVAMGLVGTEVAKEASDIVLLDDNFGSIVSAVEEGRSIYKTIKKVILYLFSTSLGEILTIVGSLVLGYPLPLLPTQIIWLNFVTDGFLVAALAMEPKEANLLKGNFEKPKKYLIDKLMVHRMITMSLPMAAGTLIIFRYYFELEMLKALTMSLSTLAVFQWFNAWNCRSETESIFRQNPLANKWLVAGTLIVIPPQLLIVYLPGLQKVFHTTALSLSNWFWVVSLAASIVLVEEVRKFFARRQLRRT
ncbi:MAG: ATPase [Candidatus Vogelbacteria bacterium CG10_big_fil_rev_8_21_14_0_10_49_38]|uniref:ATPase n=1 Tax=Candidatus Vogelbacteria bacterium CG10_big_fil_rev_8_21_14_0_10_49_38 TaxID=1975043 RepID=A0A2H0RHP5_9BACT|nr:MAG: hypothetical protein BK006_01980 [bacterium CG10_49_38]PIR46018.1 MAG: ATPase [Candidatus Vogelbacteria bacterium CG10_big_fil_rev_8_21_14_0_10_49_38]